MESFKLFICVFLNFVSQPSSYSLISRILASASRACTLAQYTVAYSDWLVRALQ